MELYRHIQEENSRNTAVRLLYSVLARENLAAKQRFRWATAFYEKQVIYIRTVFGNAANS